MQAFRTLALVAVLALLTHLTGCASTGGSSSGSSADPVEIRFTDYKSGQTMGIVNDAWLVTQGFEGETFSDRRTAFYSSTKGESDAGLKAAENAVVDGLMDVLEEYDYSEYAQAGSPAPDVSQVVQVRRGADNTFVFGRRGMDADQGTAFRETVLAFVDIYNILPQYQAVQGNVGFEQPDPRR